MVINVSFLPEVLQGFSYLLLNLQGWTTLDDPVLVSIIQNQLHLLCVLFSVHNIVALPWSVKTSTILPSLLRNIGKRFLSENYVVYLRRRCIAFQAPKDPSFVAIHNKVMISFVL